MRFKSEQQRRAVFARLALGAAGVGVGIASGFGTRRGLQIIHKRLGERAALGFLQTARTTTPAKVWKAARAAYPERLDIRKGFRVGYAPFGPAVMGKGTQRILIYPQAESGKAIRKVHAAAIAHELGHLRPGSPLVGRGQLGPLRELYEETAAHIKGAQLYKQAGGKIREYIRHGAPGYGTYITKHQRSIPVGAAVAGGAVYTGSRRPSRRRRR